MPTIDLSTLPLNAQQTLLDFYEFLQEKYSYTKTNSIDYINLYVCPFLLDHYIYKIIMVLGLATLVSAKA